MIVIDTRASLSDVYVQQVYWLVTGGILATVVAAIDYRHYERLGYLLYAVGNSRAGRVIFVRQ